MSKDKLAEAARQYLIATAHLGACPGTRDVLERAIAEAKPAPAEPLAEATRESDIALLHFYGVDDLHGLIDAMERHVKKLQAKVPKQDQPAFVRVREG